MAEKKPRKKVEQRIRKFYIAPPTPNLEPTGKWYTLLNAAKYLRMCPNTLYERCRTVLITYYINGKAFEFNEVDLEDYRRRCKRTF